MTQDRNGNWWYKDNRTGHWHLWDGQAWQVFEAPRSSSPPPIPSRSIKKSLKGGSCFLTLSISGLVAILIFSAISIVGLNFIPNQTISPAQNVTFTSILKLIGGGLLLSTIGFLMLSGGIKSILTRQAITEDEIGRRRVHKGCLGILIGVSQSFFGLIFFSTGIALISLSLYQQVFPWLGVTLVF